MAWEHFDISGSGVCKALKSETGEVFDCDYQRGIVSTGKSRTFWGYKIVVKIGEVEVVGKSKGYSESYAPALDDCNRKLELEGFRLLVAGNSKRYSESARSGGSGYGYIEGLDKAVDIMSFFA